MAWTEVEDGGRDARTLETAQLLLEAKECGESMGYPVVPPPDFETFADTYTTGPWHPFSLLDFLTEEEWERVRQACASWRTGS